MNNNKYEVKYLPSFYEELGDIVYYITNKLKNTDATRKLINDVEKSINDRTYHPHSFQIYKTNNKNKYNWYRIYVRNFTIFYTVKNNDITVAHIFYSKREIEKLI